MGMLEDDLQVPDKQCEHCGAVTHWSNYCPKPNFIVPPIVTWGEGFIQTEPPFNEAQQVRNALYAMSEEMTLAGFPGKSRAFYVLSTLNDDDALIKLGRLLKA